MSQMEILHKEENNGFLGLSYEPFMQGYVLHVELKDWSLSHYKRYLHIFSIVLDKLRSRGIVEVFGLCDTEKQVKFDLLFGFRDTGLKAIGENGNKMFILHLEV